MNTTLRRTFPAQAKVIDANTGTVEYIASDESLDSYREVIRADGWRFDRFEKNAPFVDSHNYSSIDCLLGRVIDYKVEKKALVETVRWAIDVPQNFLAQKGFAMTQAGYLKAVSVGFIPIKVVSRWDRDPRPYEEACEDLGMGDLENSQLPAAIYLEQQQLELSVCCIGANTNAVAKAYKAGLLSEADLEKLSSMQARRETAPSSDVRADDEEARLRERTALLVELQIKIANSL
jgi:hypothetical protein